MSSANDPVILISSADSEPILITAPTSFTFTNDAGEVGTLSWHDGTFRFSGNADASARVFFDALNQLSKTITR